MKTNQILVNIDQKRLHNPQLIVFKDIGEEPETYRPQKIWEMS